MRRRNNALKNALYFTYGAAWCAIVAFVARNITYGMFTPFSEMYGSVTSWVFLVLAIVVAASPFYVRKIIPPSWKVPLFCLIASLLLFAIWLSMMIVAVIQAPAI